MPRPVKAYAPELSCTFPPREALDLLDEPRHIRQCYALACGPTKKAAAEHASAAGLRLSDRDLRQAMGNDAAAMAAAGLLDEDGTVLIWPASGPGGRVVRLRPGGLHSVVATIGFRHDGRGNPVGSKVVDVIPDGVE